MSDYFTLATIIAGPVLLSFGLNLISNHMLELAEVPIFRLLSSISEKKNSTFFKGLIVSFLGISTMTANSTMLGLVNAGLIRLRAGLLFLIGAHLGPLLILFLLMLVNFEIGLFFLCLALVVFIFSKGEWGGLLYNLYGLFIGVGLICLGKFWLEQGMTLANQLELLPFESLVFESSLFLSSFTGLCVGALISWFFRSSLVSVFLFIVAREEAGLSFYFLIPGIVGVFLASFYPLYKISLSGNIHSQRVAKGGILLSLIGLIVGVIGLLSYDWSSFDGGGWALFFLYLSLKIIAAFLFLLFLVPLRKWIQKSLPDKRQKENFELEVLGRGRDMLPGMSLIQATFHIKKFKGIVDRLFNLTESYLIEGGLSARTLAKIKDYERITDNMYREIQDFLALLIEKSLSRHQAINVQSLKNVANHLESVADLLDKVASYRTRYQRLESTSIEENHQDLEAFFSDVKSFYNEVTTEIPYRSQSIQSGNDIKAKAQKLKITADGLRERYITRIDSSQTELSSLIVYSDLVSCMRKIRGLVLKIHNDLL